MKENTFHRLIREIAQADSDSKFIDCNESLRNICAFGFHVELFAKL